MVSSVVYLLNAFFGDRFERRWVQLFGAILFAGGWSGVYEIHSTAGMVTMYLVVSAGTILWLWSMHVYIPANFPTRMRSLGTGWTDGIAHLGAWGGVLIAGQLFVVLAPKNFILFITIPCALAPPPSCSRSSARTSAAAHSKRWPDSRWAAGWVRPPAFPEVSPAASGVTGGPAPTRPASRHEDHGGTPALVGNAARRLREKENTEQTTTQGKKEGR